MNRWAGGSSPARRFRSASADDQVGATFAIVGVQEREFRGFGSRATRLALVVECWCGQFVGRFSPLLVGRSGVAQVAEREMSETILVGDRCPEFN